MAFGLGNIFNAVTGLLGIGGGNNNNVLSQLAPLLAGQMTSQRIPGQTQAGEYTPAPGSFGTYNYIPTGATQIDPALIWQIMNGGAQNNAAMDQIFQTNPALLHSVLNNPYSSGLQTGANAAAGSAGNSAAMLGSIQSLLNGQLWPMLNGAIDTSNAYKDLYSGALNNPYASSYITGANDIGKNIAGAGAGIQGAATGALGSAQGIAQQALSNPYAGAAQAGANTSGAMSQGAGQTAYGQGGQFGAAAMGGLPAIQSVLNTAFDPQNALYGRALNQTMDQLGTTLARAGITDSGVGAKLMGDTLNNFNIDWQNNQLGRQAQGLQSYTSGMTGLGNQLGQGQQMQAGGAQTYGAGAMLPYQTSQAMSGANMDTLTALANLAKMTAGTVGSAGDLQLGGNAAGYNAYTGNQGNIAQAAAGLGTGSTQFNNTLGAMGNLSGQIGNLGTGATNFLQAQGMLPYSAYMTNYGDQFGALQNFINGAQGGANLNQSTMTPMQNYIGGVMQGAGNAANAASGAQTNTMNQNAQAAAGLTPLIQSGLGALSNLFGGGNNFSWAGPQFSGGTTRMGAYPSFTGAMA